jgi:uncharacterized RDD family membrane protein YckC
VAQSFGPALFLLPAKEFTHAVTVQFPPQAAAPALSYVGVGRRLLAVIIDGILLLILARIVSVLLPSSGVLSAGADAWDRFTHLGPGGALQIIILFVYFIVMEAIQGATVGKMVLGIRVVKLDGSDISWGEAIVRNLLRIVDQLPAAIPYLLGAVLIWTSPRRQRLEDRLAGTVVVRRR